MNKTCTKAGHKSKIVACSTFRSKLLPAIVQEQGCNIAVRVSDLLKTSECLAKKLTHTHTHTHTSELFLFFLSAFLFLSLFSCWSSYTQEPLQVLPVLAYSYVSRSEYWLVPILVDAINRSIGSTIAIIRIPIMGWMTIFRSECLRCHCLNGSIQGLQQRRQAIVAWSQAIKEWTRRPAATL